LGAWDLETLRELSLEDRQAKSGRRRQDRTHSEIVGVTQVKEASE